MADTPSSKRRILFVDDDPQFLQMIERVMRLWSKGNWEILTAASASAALSLLQDQALNLVVIDVCMPVVDGLQFLSIVNRRYPDLQKVVLTGFATDAYRSACLSNGAELFLEKPRTPDGMESIFATLDELTRWKPEPGFRGVLRRVGLMDVIQMECLGRSSSVLLITSPEVSGRIFIREGAIIHAEAGESKGEEAFNRLFGLVSGDFRLNPYTEPSEQTISAQWEGLLMQAAQLRDESVDATTARPIERPSPEPAPPVLPEELVEPRVRVEELMICSQAGDVLHAWQCPNTELRINFLEFISQKARVLQNTLPLGGFDRVEFRGPGSRFIAKVAAEHGIALRTSLPESSDEPSNPLARLRLSSAPPSPEQKRKAQRWFKDHLELAGLLAAGLQFSDRSGVNHSLSPKFAPPALETLRRCVADTFQVLGLQRFSANRARWTFDQTTIECAQWPDGTCLTLVVSRQTLELDSGPLEQRIKEFFAESV